MKFGIIGYDGRLGSEVRSLFSENNHQFLYGYSLNGEINKGVPEILIDSSLPKVFDKTIELVKNFNSPLIIATTGLKDSHFSILKELSNNLPIVQSYNFSIGIQVLLKLVKQANNLIGDWDIEISETHHRFKKDKPSGTAKLIESIFKERDIHAHSLRLGNVSGDHTVSFGGLGEVISINHRATSRRTFAEGILKSAEFILNAKPGLYSFTDVFLKNK